MRNLGEDPNNALVFIGYQGEGTMGRRIQKGWHEIPVNVDGGKTASIEMKMQIHTVEGLSGHSDKNQLLAFIGKLGSRPDRVICVHGDPSKTAEFARTVSKVFRTETYAPRNLEAIRLK
jgi:predicted metal-dependent RNase